MMLEDGHMLTSAKRYDTLKKTHSEEEFAKLKLIRVHPAFRVIALGLPVCHLSPSLLFIIKLFDNL